LVCLCLAGAKDWRRERAHRAGNRAGHGIYLHEATRRPMPARNPALPVDQWHGDDSAAPRMGISARRRRRSAGSAQPAASCPTCGGEDCGRDRAQLEGQRTAGDMAPQGRNMTQHDDKLQQVIRVLAMDSGYAIRWSHSTGASRKAHRYLSSARTCRREEALRRGWRPGRAPEPPRGYFRSTKDPGRSCLATVSRPVASAFPIREFSNSPSRFFWSFFDSRRPFQPKPRLFHIVEETF
jgi:hypothetical protein